MDERKRLERSTDMKRRYAEVRRREAEATPVAEPEERVTQSEWDKLGFSGKLGAIGLVVGLAGLFLGMQLVMIGLGLALFFLAMLLSFFDRWK